MSTDEILASKMEKHLPKVVEDKLSKYIVLQSLSIIWNFPLYLTIWTKKIIFEFFGGLYNYDNMFSIIKKRKMFVFASAHMRVKNQKANTLLFFLYFFIDKVIYFCLDISTVNFWILSFFGRYQKLIFFNFSSYE